MIVTQRAFFAGANYACFTSLALMEPGEEEVAAPPSRAAVAAEQATLAWSTSGSALDHLDKVPSQEQMALRDQASVEMSCSSDADISSVCEPQVSEYKFELVQGPSEDDILAMMSKWNLSHVAEELTRIAQKNRLCVDDVSGTVDQVLSFIQALLASLRNVREGVEKDVLNNVRKIRKACDAVNANSLDQMVTREIARGLPHRASGREAVLWLKRSVDFIHAAMHNLIEHPDDPVSKNCIDAYNARLSRCHHWLVRPIVRMYLNRLPKRDQLYSRLLASDPTALDKLRRSEVALGSIVSQLADICRQFDLEKIKVLR